MICQTSHQNPPMLGKHHHSEVGLLLIASYTEVDMLLF